jgi:homocysteine S-methyltransferase
LQKSVDLVKSARDRYIKDYQIVSPKFVAASVSSYGASLPGAQEFSGAYVDTTSDQTIYEFHRNRLICLLDAEPDLVLFETVPALEEARIITDLLIKTAKERTLPPIIVSFSCRDGTSTCHGDDIRKCATLIQNCDQVHGFSVNCTAPQHVLSILDTVKNHTTKILCCYPNSGEKFNGETQGWDQSDHEVDKLNFYELALLMREKGATIIGGCCRTGPSEITQIAKALKVIFSNISLIVIGLLVMFMGFTYSSILFVLRVLV